MYWTYFQRFWSVLNDLWGISRWKYLKKTIFSEENFFLEFCLILRTLRRKTKSKKVAYFRLGFLEKNENHQKIIQKWNFFQKKLSKTILIVPKRSFLTFPTTLGWFSAIPAIKIDFFRVFRSRCHDLRALNPEQKPWKSTKNNENHQKTWFF